VTEKYEFIDAECTAVPIKDETPTVGQMCAWLDVSTSGFYDWRKRPQSATEQRRELLKVNFKALFKANNLYRYVGRLGVPRRAAHPFEFGKDHFGLDQSQVRLCTAYLRHIVLTMAALAVCAVTAAQATTSAPAPILPVTPDDQPPADPGLIALTVAEVKRLFMLVHSPPATRTRWRGNQAPVPVPLLYVRAVTVRSAAGVQFAVLRSRLGN
jgi:hypothetical protein